MSFGNKTGGMSGDGMRHRYTYRCANESPRGTQHRLRFKPWGSSFEDKGDRGYPSPGGEPGEHKEIGVKKKA